jgi:hypothetical protein
MITKILLGEEQIPKQWYNIIPDMPGPLHPVIDPRTLKPVTPEDMLAIFPLALLQQEMSTERWIDIPEEVRDIYRLWRPSPLYRARRLELENLSTAGADRDLQYQTDLSKLQDLDYTQAISDMANNKMVLEAAQLSFKQVSQMTLFNYL